MFRWNKLNNLNKKTINKICFRVSILGLLFIFITICRYRNRAFIEDYENMYVENLENQDKTDDKENVDSQQNISSQPTPPTEAEMKSPGYLKLTSLTVPNVKQYVNRTIENLAKSIRPDVQGPPGRLGPQGVKGECGGLYTNKGPLRFMTDPTLFLSRGLTDANKLTVSNRTYKPDQTWIHDKDGKLINQAGNCLTATLDGDLAIADCMSAEKWNYIGKNSQLRTTKPVGGSNKCLTLKNVPEKGKDSQYTLSLENCDSGPHPDQAWTFH